MPRLLMFTIVLQFHNIISLIKTDYIDDVWYPAVSFCCLSVIKTSQDQNQFVLVLASWCNYIKNKVTVK